MGRPICPERLLIRLDKGTPVACSVQPEAVQALKRGESWKSA
jgi:hypothetical protein